MAFRNRIRLPFYLSQPQFPMERNVFRNAAGSTLLLSATIRNTYKGKTDQLPEDWHRKLVIALTHKDLTIEDTRFITDVVMEGDYGIEWEDFLSKPIAPATFTIQTTPFNASSSNCQTCSEITQLDLVDDYTDEIFDEGTTNEFPDIVTANDEICCYPYTIEIVSYNTTWFENVSITQEGVVTFTVKDTVPPMDDVLLATYRVTCPNGGYDEANIYVNIDGSDTSCFPPSDLQITSSIEGFVISWIRNPLPANGYNWFLYSCDDVYTVLDSGNIPTNNSINFPDTLDPGCYIFAIQADCGGTESDVVTLEFTQPGGRGAGNCGTFQFYYVPVETSPTQSITFLNCDGVMETEYFTYSKAIERCILIDANDDPVYVAASTSEIIITYIEPC